MIQADDIPGNNNNMNGDNKPKNNEREPGQGNSDDGLTRRLGGDILSRGIKEQENLKKGEGNGEEERLREGSQGGSKGQKN